MEQEKLWNGNYVKVWMANFMIFSVFQLVMGIIMSYTKFRLNVQLVTAEKQRKEIYMLNKSQNSFFSNMSHEIRTPINTIIGLVGIPPIDFYDTPLHTIVMISVIISWNSFRICCLA